MPASAMPFLASSGSTAPAAATDQSPTRRATFSYALPVPGWIGTRISASSSPRPTTVSYGPRWNSRTGTFRSPSAPLMTAVARAAANAADRSSDGSAWHSDPPTVPHSRTIGVGDDAFGVVEDREVLAGEGRVEQVRVPGQGADAQLVAVEPDEGELGQAVDVDEHLGLGQPQLHHRDQAVAAGHDPGLRPAQQRQRVLDAGRPLVLDVRRNLHVSIIRPVPPIAQPNLSDH